MSFFDDTFPDDAHSYDRPATEQPTQRIPVVRLPSAPAEPRRHSRRAGASPAPARRHARPDSALRPTSQPSESSMSPRRQRGRRRRGRSTLWRAATTATGFSLLLVLAVASIAGFAYRKYNNQITRVSVLQTHDHNIRNPARQQHAENFLVLGSDTRAGADSKFGHTAGARSDTTMLVHLSPDRGKATVISIPRDSWVHIPTCTGADGKTVAAHSDMFNSAFSIGGPKCTIATVQKLTGIAVTHFVEIDFSGFESMVDAMGSVTICSPQTVSDPKSGLKLHPGENRLDGAGALAFVRARETLGDGSDLGRIKRQQIFLGAVLRQAMTGSTLTNPKRLTSFLDAATKAVTVDKGTTFSDLRSLTASLQGLDPKKVTFYTAPIANADYTPPGTSMTGRVLLDDSKGRLLYDSVINDKKPVWVKQVAGKSKVVPSTTPTASTSAPASGSAPSEKALKKVTVAPTGTKLKPGPTPTSSINAGQHSCSL